MARGLTLTDVIAQLNSDSQDSIDLSDTEVVDVFVGDAETLSIHPAETIAAPSVPYPVNLLDDAGPQGYWRMDDLNGTSGIYDSSPFGVKQNGTANGTLTYGVAGAMNGSKGITFDGSTGYISVPSSPQLAVPGTCAFECWLKVTSLAAVQTVISKGAGSEYEVDINTDGSVSLSFGGSSADNFLDAPTAGLESISNILDANTSTLTTDISGWTAASGSQTQTLTKTYSCTDTATYDTNGNNRAGYDNGYCYQGYFSSTNGNQFSLIQFNASQIQSDLAGASITKVEVYLSDVGWYYNSGGTAIIGYYRNITNLSGNQSYSNVSADWNQAGFSSGQAQWVTISNSIGTALQNGTALGIALGKAPNNSLTYYGYFHGFGQSGAPQLRITYQVNVTSTNTTIARSSTQDKDGDGFSAAITATAAGNASMFTSNSWPVSPNTPYTFSAWIWSPVATTANLELDWRDSNFNFLTYDSNALQGNQPTLLASGWTQVLLTSTAPSNAYNVTPVVGVTATAASQTFYADVMVMSAFPWWVANDPDWVAQAGAHAHSGSYSLALIAQGANECAAETANLYSLTPGTTYTASFWCYTTKAGESANIAVNTYDANGTYQTQYARTGVALTQNAWTQVAFTFTPTGSQVQGRLIVAPVATAALEVIWVDDMFLGTPASSGVVTVTVCPAGTVTAGAWHHLAVVRNATASTVTGYFDGVQKASLGYTGSAVATSAAVFLGAKNNAGAAAQFFNGALDEVAFYSRLLTATEVANRYAWATSAACVSPSWGHQNWGQFQYANPGSPSSAQYGNANWGSSTYG
ncbi:LamG-like jellyroll fold domain-containing protein [Streptomyces sp. NPDC093261]|uniref:LamG-like jellyroll fold domain-containing protein n=1 Tax=Streptomyces sp. NPDC093261 TaxID=3366037 RepID=UPI0038183344